MAQETTTEQLLARVAQRDEAALGKLYDQTSASLYGLIAKVISDSESAQDILKGVYVRLWRDAKRIEADGGSVVAWLTLEARAKAVDWQRSHSGSRAMAHARLQGLLKFHSWMPRPGEIAQIEKRRQLLEKLVRHLPKPQSKLLELAILEGFTETEIARRHDQPPGRIEHELRAGLRFLRHRLRAVLGTWTADI